MLQIVIGVTIVNGSGLTMPGDTLALTIGMQFGSYYYVAVASDVTVLSKAVLHTGNEVSERLHLLPVVL